MKCPQCHVTKLVSSTSYFNRKKITIGNFCPRCLKFITFDDRFNKIREDIIKEIPKPKFSKLKKQRRLCVYCRDNGIINRQKWTLRKMPKRKDETQHWKGTCQKCGGVWGQNNNKEYDLIDPNQTDYALGL